MADYHVWASGDNSDGLSWETAYQTLHAAIGGVPLAGGFDIIARAGAYAENSGSNYLATARAFTAPVVVRNETIGGTDVIVNTSGAGTPAYLIDLNGAANLTFRDITFAATQSNTSTVIAIRGTSANLTFIRCRTTAVGGMASATGVNFITNPTGSNFTFIGCAISGKGTTGGGGISAYGKSAAETISNLAFINCDVTTGGRFALRAKYVDGLTISGGHYEPLNQVLGQTALWFGEDNNQTDGHVTGLVVTDVDVVSTGGHGILLGGITTSPIIDRVRIAAGGDYGFVDKSNGATVRNCLIVGGSTGPLVFKGTNWDGGNHTTTSTYDNCTIINTIGAGALFVWEQVDEDASTMPYNCTLTNCAVKATAGVVFVRVAAFCTWANNMVFDHGVYQGTEGTIKPTITNSVNGTLSVDAMYIPFANGNCDVGRGLPGKRLLGASDVYGRSVLRADAEAIGAVSPQRRNPRNILQPIVQYASEMVSI